MPFTIVLAHGAFAESASWDGVIPSLFRAGNRVVAGGNPGHREQPMGVVDTARARSNVSQLQAKLCAEESTMEDRAVQNPHTTTGPGSLTAQQRRVATLAASGLSNREIGKHLAVSHRTVGAHLRAVFVKLDITRRASLPEALREAVGQPDMPTARDLRLSTRLTSGEIDIALLAARGLTNKQIGERLYFSHRTIGTRLYRMYPKLGVSSRSAIGRALATAAVSGDIGDTKVHTSGPADAGRSVSDRDGATEACRPIGRRPARAESPTRGHVRPPGVQL